MFFFGFCADFLDLIFGFVGLLCLARVEGRRVEVWFHGFSVGLE